MRVALAALTLASIVVPIGHLEAQAQPLRQEVEALHAEMVEAFRKDPKTVAQYYTDDASVLGGGGRYVGRAQLDQYWSQIPAGAEWTLEVIEVGGGGDSPWVRGKSVLQSQSGRRMETEYIGLLKRQPDGKLRFYVDMYVSASPAVRRTQ